MTRSSNSAWHRLIALAGIGSLILFAGGCDSAGSKSDSLFQQLIGTWCIDRIQLNRNEVNLEAEDAVRIEFLKQGDNRPYRIIRSASDDTTQRGRVRIQENNVLQMTVGTGLLEWSFDFGKPEDVSESVRFQFRGDTNESVQDFLEALGVSGDAQRLQLDLERHSG